MILITAIVKVRNQTQNRTYKGAQEFLVITKLEDVHTEVEERGAVDLQYPLQSKASPAWAN